mgnify:CR=1 FL=1
MYRRARAVAEGMRVVMGKGRAGYYEANADGPVQARVMQAFDNVENQ